MGKNESDIDRKVDKVLNAVSLGSNHTTMRHKQKNSTRFLKKVSPGGLALLVGAMLVSGALLFGLYTGTQEGDIELSGAVSNVYFDGSQLNTETFSFPMDLSSMAPGDVFTFSHNAEAIPGLDSWDLSFDADLVTGFIPGDEYYGFYFDIQQEGVSVIDEVLTIHAGAGEVFFDFVYELDPAFVEPSEPLPFSLGVILEHHTILGCVAVDDALTIPLIDVGGSAYVLDNDFDLEFPGSDLDIISFDINGLDMSVSIQGVYPDEYIGLGFYVTKPPVGVYEMYYTIESTSGFTDTGTLVVTIV